MKKVLRFLLILILLLVVIFVIAGLMAPKEETITSTIEINAPKEQVWEQMVVVKNNKNWSPFTEQEPNIELTYAGVDGQPGSSYHWKGKKMGEGTMTLMSVTGNSLNYELAFVEPFEGKADGTMQVEDAGEGKTKATWTFHSVNESFLWGAMGQVMSMFHSMQGDFDHGMQNLKAYVESHKVEAPAPAAMDIQEVQFTDHIYAGVRKVVKWQEMDKYFPQTYEAQSKTVGSRIIGPATAIYYTWDTVKQESDAFAGFPVAEDKPVDGATILKVAASKAYLIVYTGDPSKTMEAHEKLNAHALANKATVTMKLEEYVKSANEEKDMNKWVTNIYYLVK